MKISLMEPILTEEMIDAAMNAFKKEFFLKGESVEKFEKEFAEYVGVTHAIAVNSGTSALHLSLLSLGIEEGNVVVTTPATFIATANVITYVRAKPAFADIALESYNIDPNEVRKVLEINGERIKAIIPVHLYGYPCKMDEMMKIAEEYNVAVVEDACQAHGAAYKGKKAGSWGDIGTFSFYPSKNMTVAGDGGMVVTDDSEVAEKIKKLRDVGRSLENSSLHKDIGFTARLNTANAAIGRVQLRHLDEWNERRREIGREYNKMLNGIGDIKLPPSENENSKPVWHLYVIRTRYRDKLKKYLEERGIQCGIHYSIPVHLQPPYQKMGFTKGMFPNSERCAEEVLSLPMHPNLTEEEVRYIVRNIKQFYEEKIK